MGCSSFTGCKHIQLDEPLFAREPTKALDYGMDCAVKCFKDVGPDVAKYTHLCRGYPNYLVRIVDFTLPMFFIIQSNG